ncbi:MAG: L-rhamnose/proton symporter RhaT [Kiritimatiellae bacterium]|nr:L-rhamnose/proton symporter RhaT [Kiritimatiellia bacterium]
MTANPILGTGVFLIGGMAAALYLLPFRAVKGWAYETGWLVSVLAGWLVFPLVFDACVIPDLGAVLAQGGWPVLARTVGFGALWGVGALCWALMVRYLGVGLGLAIGAGLCAATGTLLPPIVSGNAAALVATKGARIVLAGVFVSLVGIAFVGAAGRLKEGEMSEVEKKKSVAEYDFKKGIVTAVVAGFASAGINFGLQGAPVLEQAALGQGVNPLWAGMPVLTVTLWGGVIVQIIWSFVQHRQHHSFSDYLRNSNAQPSTFNLQLRNYALSASVGLIGVMQFFTQKVGEPLMGEMRYISFAVLMASAIFFSSGVGILLGEWRGTGRMTRASLAFGILLLLLSFVLISCGSKA